MPPDTIQVSAPAVSFFRRYRTLLVIAVLAVLLVAGGFLFMPSRHDVELHAVVTSFNTNDVDGAIAKADQMLADNPDDVATLVAKSLALAQKGSLGFDETKYGMQAAAIAEQAITLDPKSSEAYRALGYAKEIQQDYAGAHAAYETALTLDPKNALAIFGNAHAYDLEGDIVKAETGYRAALGVDQNCYPAHLGLGRIYNAQGEREKALAEFKLVYMNAPNLHNKAEAAYSVGTLLIAKGDDALARGYLEKATLVDPEYPLGWYGLGTVLYIQATAMSSLPAAQRGNLILGSVTALNKAITLNPEQSAAYLQLGEAFYVIGEKDAALAAFKKAAVVIPSDITLSATEKMQMLRQATDLSARITKAK